jgi:hypothetical protein
MAERAFHEIRKRTEGSSPYIGAARVWLGKLKEQMRFQGLDQLLWRNLPIAEGVSCSVWSIHGQDGIEIQEGGKKEECVSFCNLFLESGLVDTGVIVTTDATKYDPGTLWLSSRLREYAGVGDSFGRGETVKLLGKIKFDKCEEKLTQGEKVNSVSPQPSRAFGVNSISKKFTCLNQPASIFSGKMRLFMQAQFGGNGKYFHWVLDEMGVSLLYDGETWVDCWSTNTFGVFTHEDHSFSMIQITPNGAWQWPVVLTPCGEYMRKWLVRRLKKKSFSKETIDRVHAYMFAEAAIDFTKVQQILYQDVMQGIYAWGSPIGNLGWKFNWKGDKANMVLQRRKPGSTDANARWQGSLAQLTFVEGHDKVLSGFVEWMEQGTDWVLRSGKDFIRIPIPGLDYYDLFRISQSLTAYALFTCDSPIDCYYDSSDTLVVLRFKLNLVQRTETDPGYPNPQNTTCGLTIVSSCVGKMTNFVDGGFYTQRYDGKRKDGSFNVWSEHAHPTGYYGAGISLAGYHVNLPCDGTQVPGCAGGQGSFGLTHEYTWFGISSNWVGTVQYNTLMMYPRFNSEAWYIGTDNQYFGNAGSQYGTCHVSTKEEDYCYDGSDPDQNQHLMGKHDVTVTVLMGPPASNGIIDRALYICGTYQNFNGPLDARHVKINLSLKDRDKVIEDAWHSTGNENIWPLIECDADNVDFNIGVGTEGWYGFNDWSSAFEPPTLDNPLYQAWLAVRESVGGAAQYAPSPSFTFPDVLEGGYGHEGPMYGPVFVGHE